MTQRAAPARPTLRRLLPPGARLWLVRSRVRDPASAFRLILFHVVPGILDEAGKEFIRHG